MAKPRNFNIKNDIKDKQIRRNGIKKTATKSTWKRFKIEYVASAVVVVILSFAVYIYLRNMRLQSLIITPLDAPKVVDDSVQISKGFWGSYRPGVYFGMKTRSPNSPVMGLMWFAQEMVDNRLPIRHWCRQEDGLPRYGWLEHDGVNFGVQEIEDVNHLLTTSFVTVPGDNGGTWTARISSVPKREKAPALSLLFYVALDGEGSLWPNLSGPSKYVTGVTRSTGYFSLKFLTDRSKVLQSQHLATRSPGLQWLTETVLNNLAYYGTEGASGKGFVGLAANKNSDPRHEQDPNFVVYQVTVNGPFEMEVVYGSEENGHVADGEGLSGSTFTHSLQELRTLFEARFQQVFGLRSKKYNESQVAFGKAALSNMLGGIGYFHGSSIVQGPYNEEPVLYWDAPLYTAVPSRSFFPRGFLWDEGFHNLLVERWDRSVTLDILGHWMDLMNAEGWIPREQILGEESRSRVPAEFVVQRNTNANPPTFFLTLRELLLGTASIHGGDDFDWSEYARDIFPRLRAWYSWFNETQVGKVPGSYRWRGRDPNDPRQLNPKTLTSGLDDYPRASHPTDDERHLDLRCWMTMASEVMVDLAKLAGESDQEFLDTYRYLKDNGLLDALHWSEELGTYADYGLHTDSVRLARPKPPERPQGPKPDKVRVVDDRPQLRFVNAFGYNSLFPLLLRILDPDSPKLGKLLESLRDPKLLWTDHGLRSLARNSPLYMKRNTEHDPPYWRGAVWLNINYLAVTALSHYGRVQGPYKVQAGKLARELRTNLVNNMYRVYKKSGYIWENYDDSSGEGKGSHPFTGWSALIVLIMAEE